ncbi:disulfide bond formation protein B [Pseudoxanthomonas dokdonensis]|uniref:Disulfide bond formation protein B n=1 Tax=Pseudoxanthomonas dokdonensis TaxID=344882 RepID=A0A0R0CEJ9_9GAMM|nr:disulfide bond formation protein B [Pseudoxanthomonas dokdonensis]KRG68143.1 disulfide bond formation protein B [Pseudoxanthomonas dokdonensis]
MNPFRWSFRAQFFLGFLACVALLAYALYLEHYQHLVPCPLCTFQRGAFALLGLVFLLGALAGPRRKGGRGAFGLFALAAAGLGIAIAGRHVWMQSLPPDQVPACGPDLAYMMDAFPLADVLKQVLSGSGQCAVVDWSFLGLAMPAWSLICFVVLALWALFAGFSHRKSRFA